VTLTDGVPRLWIHGTSDANVAPAISRHYWEAAAEPKCALWVVGSEHMLDVARGAVYNPLKEWVTQTARAEAGAGAGTGTAPFASDNAVWNKMTWLVTGAHVSVMPMRAAAAKRVGSARFGESSSSGGSVAVVREGVGGATVAAARRAAAVTGQATKEAGGDTACGGAGGVNSGGAGGGSVSPLGDLRRAWSRHVSSKKHGGVGSATKKPPPLAEVGTGWVDVSAALGAGHVQAAAEVNSLVKTTSLASLLKNPHTKGYSE